MHDHRAQHLPEQLSATIRAYHARGWSPATSTNYSYRLPGQSDSLFVSRSGIDKSMFCADDFIEVDLKGQPLPAYAQIRPSAETLIHCALYQLFPDTQCILHTHSVYASLHSSIADNSITLAQHELLKAYPGIDTHDTRVELSVFNNSQDMQAFSQALLQHAAQLTIPAFIIRRHGTYAWGKDLTAAKRHLEATEHLLEVEWKLR